LHEHAKPQGQKLTNSKCNRQTVTFKLLHLTKNFSSLVTFLSEFYIWKLHTHAALGMLVDSGVTVGRR